jgi:hypothetical protein
MAQWNVYPQATDTVAEMEVSDPLGQINVALSPLGIYINTATGWQLVGAPSGAGIPPVPASERLS